MTADLSDSGDSGTAGTTRYLRFLLIAMLLLPVLLFGSASWLNYRAAFRDARERVLRAADAIDQQAERVFETDEVILEEVAEHVADMDWAEIAGSQALHEYLKRVAAYPQIAAVGLVSPDRVLAASSSAFPLPPTIVSPRTFLPIERPGREPLYISPVSPGSRSGKDQFSLARYKPNSDKTADGGGMIFVSMQPSSFTDYYSSIVNPVDYTVTTALSDGAILVRYPDEALAGRVLSPESGYRRTTAQNPQRGIYDAVSELDGIRRLFAYSKAGSYPVYVTVGLNRSSVIGGWARLMASHLIFGVPATSCLIALAFFALRRSEAADRALAEARVEAERRKAAEESLRHAQRIEAVGRLTGGVAHDFNNLLTAITGNLDMILRRPEEASRVKRLAEAALRGALRGERLTHQLLMFSRRQVMRPETLNLNRLLIEFEGLMRRAAGERIELEMKLDPGLDPSRVDRAQFEAAVLNLIVNARDALTAGGRIIVETHNVTLDEAYAERNAEVMAGSYVLLTVTDNGSGIEKDVLPRVFEPFFTTKEIGKGSGLGLSQVYGFAKESGGHVQIYTEVGHGTTIKLYLPKSVEPAVEPARSELVPLRTAGPSETVLVVEDDEAVLVMAVESLRDLGYRVLVAHGGREALDIVNSSENIDILFSDIVMPGGINGAQLAMEARRLRPSIKVLLTSGYTGAALRSEHGLPPDLPVLGKPYRRDQLAAQLRVIVGGQAR